MVGTDPGFIRLSVSFRFTARIKQSVLKCSEHMPNVPVGLKFFRCWQTNLFHFADVTAWRRSMHGNAQFFIGDSAAILHYTPSWRHFRDCKHQKSSSLQDIQLRLDCIENWPRCFAAMRIWRHFLCARLVPTRLWYARSFLNRVMADGRNQETRSK